MSRRPATGRRRPARRRIARSLLTVLLLLCTGMLLTPSARASAPADASPGVRADDGAYLTAAERVDDRILDLTIHSPALGREGHARVLLPTGYDRDHRRLPVLYLLHGCCDSTPGWRAWTDNTDVVRATARTRALIVLPEGGPMGFYSNWWNHGAGATPAWETFHLTEVRQLVERTLRTNGRRAVAGLSMGGFGALSYAGRHPGMFRSAASFSGVVDTGADPQRLLDVVAGYTDDPTALWGDPHAQADIWRAHNPYDVLRRLPRGFPVFVSTGNGTPGPLDPPDAQPDTLEQWLGGMSERYVAQARAHGLRVTADLYGPGTHTWPYWERELHRALPMLTASLTK
ncbi:alpha/beta hydrolase [Streptomyces niger]|uniref:alpha/beta hydrolase n=1 Tax=Streptomyces niger TaxID=66373 RepID=UPI00069B8E62|nr:alpha/beta hydrolase family protein [Streptomyces niger]